MTASPEPTDLAALVALARYGTLSAAARRGGVAVSTISRRIAALEASTGLVLVDRQNRGALLTEAGRRLAEAAEPLASQLEQVSALAASLRGGASLRPVRVSATEMVIAEVLAPQLGALLNGLNALPVSLRSEAEIVSLATRNAEIAVRMVRPEGASLILRKLPALTLSLWASRDYLTGRTVTDLAAERLIAYDDTYGPIPETAWIERLGLGSAVVLRSGSSRALVAAALAGVGVALLPDAIAARHRELGRLDVGLRFAPRSPWLTYHRDLQRDKSVRRVADWIVGSFHALTARSDVR